MEWSIQEVTRATGLTSRTLRHYDRIGLLPPTSVGAGGIRHYDRQALLRLQRILVWRELGLPLATIAELADGTTDDVAALGEQLALLLRERDRMNDRIAAIEATIAALEKGDPIMPESMFDGFDHTKYDAEVRQRWGDEAADRSDRWWRELGESGQQAFRREMEELASAWDAAAAAEIDPASEAAQQLAARHVAWLAKSWQGTRPSAEQVKGISQLYVDDERFAANYNRVTPTGPQFVRDALHIFADTHMSD